MSVQQASQLQIVNQRGDRLVNAVDAGLVGAFEAIVRVPAAGKNLHEPHAVFDQPPGQQAFPGEGIHSVFPDAIHSLRLSGFLVEFQDFRHLHLHAEAEFVVRHARGQFVVLSVPLRVGVVGCTTHFENPLEVG